MSGKGDDRRPLSVDEETFAANWDRIFNGARLGANSGSNPANDGSIPSAPANFPLAVMSDASDCSDRQQRVRPDHAAASRERETYVDDATG